MVDLAGFWVIKTLILCIGSNIGEIRCLVNNTTVIVKWIGIRDYHMYIWRMFFDPTNTVSNYTTFSVFTNNIIYYKTAKF